MRSAVRADISVWLAMVITTALLIWRLRPAGVSLSDLGVTGTPAGPGWLLALAGIVGAAVVASAPRIQSLSWPALQAMTVLATTCWSAALIAYRHPEYDAAEVGTYLGNALARALDGLQRVGGWLPPLVIGLSAAAAMVLLNAAMQSLAGRVQAQRLAPAVMLTPAAALLADGLQVLALVAVSGVLALSAMASERGRGLLWSTGLALLSGVLLFTGALAGFACIAAGIGMLCIYFLRRRSLMIIVAALGVLVSLLSGAAIGWSWPHHFGEASALSLADPAGLAAVIVLGSLAVIALGGPTHREAWRKVRGTPAWPLMLTGLVAAFLALLTRPATLAVIPAAAAWLPLLSVAASAPARAAGTPEGPSAIGLALTAAAGIAATAAMSLIA